MLPHIYLCMILMTVTYLNTVNAKPAPSADRDLQNQKFSDAAMMKHFGSNQFLISHPYDEGDDSIDEDEIRYEKRQSNKKWAKFYQGSQSPYTIAFPALIRTRRWIE